MPAYEIFVHCSECGGEHPLLIKIHLDDGPEHKESIAASFRDRSVPPQVSAIKGRKALCLKTGRKFSLANEDEVFLVPAYP